MSARSARAMLLHRSSGCRQQTANTIMQGVRHASSSNEPVKIPPESPQFVHVPQSPQQSFHAVRSMKGTLPTPRRIFKSNEKKTSKMYLENTIPEPIFKNNAAENAPSTEAKEWIEWKAAGSALRRKNFREGIVELKQRDNITRRRQQKSREEKRLAYERGINAPERTDEILSRPSVLSFMNSPEIWKQNKELKAAEFEQRKARYEEMQRAKEDEKRTAVHELYVNAKNFIVTHEQLEAKITEVFDSPFYQVNPEMGVWDEQGFPENTAYLLGSANQEAGSAVNQKKGYTEITRERLQRVAEELTGGKMGS